MNATKKFRIPTLRHCNNRGFVCLNGKRIYLGEWGKPETQDAYECTIAEWLSNKKSFQITKDELTIAELYRDYWHHCEEYFRKPNREHTSSLAIVKQACWSNPDCGTSV